MISDAGMIRHGICIADGARRHSLRRRAVENRSPKALVALRAHRSPGHLGRVEGFGLSGGHGTECTDTSAAMRIGPPIATLTW